MVQPKALRLDKGGRSGLAGSLAAAWLLLLLLEPRGAILGAKAGHYAAAGILGLNSSADWEPVDCIFYTIPIEEENAPNGTKRARSAVWIQ